MLFVACGTGTVEVLQNKSASLVYKLRHNLSNTSLHVTQRLPGLVLISPLSQYTPNLSCRSATQFPHPLLWANFGGVTAVSRLTVMSTCTRLVDATRNFPYLVHDRLEASRALGGALLCAAAAASNAYTLPAEGARHLARARPRCRPAVYWQPRHLRCRQGSPNGSAAAHGRALSRGGRCRAGRGALPRRS